MRLLLALACLSACHKKQPSRLTEFAVKFVEDGRANGIPPEAIDETLINRVHRAQKVRLAGQGGAPPDILVKIWHDESELHGTRAEQSARQRASAAAALKRTLKGNCHAEVDDMGSKLRIGALTEPPDNAPDEVKSGLGQLRSDLAQAHLVRIGCEQGTLGLMAIAEQKQWRVIDLFAVGGGPRLDVKPGANEGPARPAQ